MKGLNSWPKPINRKSGASDCRLPVKYQHNGTVMQTPNGTGPPCATPAITWLTRFCGGPQKTEAACADCRRTVEPHHDGTVHWHMMVFAHPEEIDSIVAITRDIAIQEVTPRTGR